MDPQAQERERKNMASQVVEVSRGFDTWMTYFQLFWSYFARKGLYDRKKGSATSFIAFSNVYVLVL